MVNGLTILTKTKATKKPKKKPKVRPVQTFPEANRQALERKLGHIFENPDLLWEALQADGNGVKQIGDRKIEDGNKKLALLGDKCIPIVVINDWYHSGGSRYDGHILVSAIGKDSYLDKRTREASLETLINTNPSFLKGGRVIPPRTMSATVEALIGAVFVDSSEKLKAVKIAMEGIGTF